MKNAFYLLLFIHDIIIVELTFKGWYMTMEDFKEAALALHKKKKGKIAIKSKVPLKTSRDLSLAYTPGVAEPCIEIIKNPDSDYDYTSKGNMVAIITDGSAVLGLGNIGPRAALPVMEGKAILLKQFAGVDGIPLCLDTQDSAELIETIIRLAPSFGAIMLEDIAAPQCVTIERTLTKQLSIPIFHDDQHGTAIVVTAAVLNSTRFLKKDVKSLRVVVSGTGAAGSSVCRMLKGIQVSTIYAFNKQGIVSNKKYMEYDFVIKELLDEKIITSFDRYETDTLDEIMKDADVFIGVSAANLVTSSMIQSMSCNSIIFAMANPNPEINPHLAKESGAVIVGTGRSDYPNQINNVLIFPGLIKGALQARANAVTMEMKLAACYALAHLIKDDELRHDYIIPSPFDKRVVKAVAKAVRIAAIQ
jgi:malate dehydrogenase (oxaloacetate-decarboxylating)